MRLSRFGMLSCVIGITACVLFAGCSTTPKVDWESRIGNYTHDQAILELGPPDKTATLTDGTVVAEWLVSRMERSRLIYNTGFGYGGRYPYYAGVGVTTYSNPSVAEWFLRLVFDKDGVLLETKKYVRN